MPSPITYAVLADVFLDTNSAESFTALTSFQSMNESFVSLHNFLSSSECSSLGVERIACNYGLNGNGFDYWDLSGTCGENAWAVFRWKNAYNQFYMLMQFSSNAVFGSSPGNPASTSTSFQNGLSFSFAFTNNGTNPWGGTIFNNGQDVKSTPVWVGNDENVLVFPRSNSVGGQDSATRSGMVSLLTKESLTKTYNALINEKFYGKRSILHFVVSKNDFIGIFDSGGMGSHSVLYFGKYETLSEITGSTAPYCMLYSDQTTAANFTAFGQYYTYGSKTLLNSNLISDNIGANLNGGITNPKRNQVGSLMTGYIGFSSSSFLGQKTSFATNYSGLGNSTMYFNTTINNGGLELMKIPLGWQEKFTNSSSEFYPIPPTVVGKLSFIRAVNSIQSSAKLSNGKWLVIGSSANSTYKFAIPWSPSYNGPYYTNSRTGVKILETQNF